MMKLERAVKKAQEKIASVGSSSISNQLSTDVENLLTSSQGTSLGLRLLLEWFRSNPGQEVKKIILNALVTVMTSSSRAQFSSGEGSFMYPDAYFTCSTSRDDCVTIPPLNLDRLRGYSFTALICLQDDPNSKKGSHRGLYRFQTSGDHGTEAVLWVVPNQPVSILVRARSLGDRDWQSVKCSLPSLKINCWHHIAVAHSHPYLASDMLTVYIDGVKHGEFALNYPKLEEQATKNVIGCGFGGSFSKPTLYEGALNDHQAVEVVLGVSRTRVAIPNPDSSLGRTKFSKAKVRHHIDPSASASAVHAQQQTLQSHVSKRFSLSKVGHVTAEGISELRSSVTEILNFAPVAGGKLHAAASAASARLTSALPSSPRVFRTSTATREKWEMGIPQKQKLSKLHKYDDLPIVFTYDARTCIGGKETCEGWESKVVSGVMETLSVNGKRKGSGAEQVVEPVSLSFLKALDYSATSFDTPKASMYARFCGSACAVFDRESHPSLEPLGGLLSLMVSIIQLLPEVVKDEFDLHSYGDLSRGFSSDDVAILPMLVDVIGEALFAREIYREDFANLGGFGLLGWVLQRLPPKALTMELVKSCVQSVLRAGYTDASLRCEGWLLLLFDHNIWGRADYAVQRYWIQRLLDYVGQNSLECRLVLGVQTVMDLMEACSLPQTSDNNNLIRLSTDCSTPLVEIIRLFFQTKGLADDDESIALATAAAAAALSLDDQKQSRDTSGAGVRSVEFNKDPGPLASEMSALLGFISKFPRAKVTGELLRMIAALLLPLVVHTRKWSEDEVGVARSVYESLQAVGGIDILLGIGSRDSETKLTPVSAKSSSSSSAKKQGMRIIETITTGVVNRSGQQNTGQNEGIALESPPASPGTIGTDQPPVTPTTPTTPPSSKETIAEESPNGLLSAANNVPPSTRAAMILLIGRMILLQGEIEVAALLREHSNSQTQQASIIEVTRTRRQKQFGIVLRSIMPTASFRMIPASNSSTTKTTNLAAHALVLDALLPVVLGSASTSEDIDDFVPHDDSLRLAVPDSLPILGGMLASLAEADEETKLVAAREVLLKLSLVLKASYSAREQVSSLPRWQTWLIPVVLLNDRSLNQLDDESADYLLCEVATDLLCTLLEHETQRANDPIQEAKKLNRAQYGWYSWQGLAEGTMRIVKEKERSLIMDRVVKAKQDPKERFLIPEYNAWAERKATKKTARVLRQTLERVWERLLVRLRASGLHRDAVHNFMMTLAMAEETLLEDVNRLKLKPLSAGGIISSSSSTSFIALPPASGNSNEPVVRKPYQCNAKCAIDDRYGTKWVDAMEPSTSVADTPAGTSWLSYRYPSYPFLSKPGTDNLDSDERPATRHRVVFYIVKSAYDMPELDPAGWTLFGRDSSCTSEGSAGWVVLDRRSEIRFTVRYQAMTCWVQHTGFFEEYKIVFDPPAGLGEGKLVKQANGSKLLVKMQIGQVSLHECDVEEWDKDQKQPAATTVLTSVTPDRMEESEGYQVQKCLEANGKELHRFVRVALETITFIRDDTSSFSPPPSPRSSGKASSRGGRKDQTPAKGQVENMPKRAVVRLIGHVLRNAMYFPLPVLKKAASLVRSFMVDDLAVPSKSNLVLIHVLLHCLHHALCSLVSAQQQCDDDEEKQEKVDILFGLVLLLLPSLASTGSGKDSPRNSNNNAQQPITSITSVANFLQIWNFRSSSSYSSLNATVFTSLQTELQGELVYRHVSFTVERSSTTAMARRANPVEVAAYGAGRSHRPVGLPKSARKRLSSLLFELKERSFTSIVSRIGLYNQIERQWRRILERDEIEVSLIGKSKLIRDKAAADDEQLGYKRSALKTLGPFVDRKLGMRLQLAPNPNGDPHFGASSGIADRVKRKTMEAGKKAVEKPEEASTAAGDLLGLDDFDQFEDKKKELLRDEEGSTPGLFGMGGNNNTSWENIGAKLSKQIEIADMSLMTKQEEELGQLEDGEGEDDKTDNEDEPAMVTAKKGEVGVDENTTEDKKSSRLLSFTKTLRIETKKPTSMVDVDDDATGGEDDEERSAIVPPSPPSAVSLLQQHHQSSLSSDRKRQKLTIEEWINRSPDPIRGETKDPWPMKGEMVYAAARCHLIRPELEVTGRMIISQGAIYFDPDPPNAEEYYILRPKDHDGGERTEHESNYVADNSKKWQQDLLKSEEDNEVTKKATSFYVNLVQQIKKRDEYKRKHKRRKRVAWAIREDLDKVFLRRYRMRDSALEIYVKGNQNKSYFFDFDPLVSCTLVETGKSAEEDSEMYTVREKTVHNGNRVRNIIMNKLWNLLPSNVRKRSQKPGESVRNLVHRYTSVWQKRGMSNFEYLMKLNSLAGRSTSDLTQYPVFPWVLSDYVSEEVDLTKETTFRDLTKPMGALSEERLMDARERYRTFDDPSTPKFHYGSHYSTMTGVVLYYLVRMEPFTTLHVKMQDGHLDIPDRLFNSVQGTWDMCTTVQSEVKELIPEFYCMPEFLVNHNEIDLGTTQDGIAVNNVALPPWAKGSAEVFVTKMREALESDYVSKNLHHWIDLIFGHKARLPDAVEADNVFYYLTYPGAVDMESIEDPAMRLATELQIKHFGQCPLQIFSRPHPQRIDKIQPPMALSSVLSVHRQESLLLDFGDGEKEQLDYDGSQSCIVHSDNGSVLAVRLLENRAICLFEGGDLCCYIWGQSEDAPVDKKRQDSTSTQESVDSSQQQEQEKGELLEVESPPLVLLPSPESLEARTPGQEDVFCPPIHHLPLNSIRRRLNWSKGEEDDHEGASDSHGRRRSSLSPAVVEQIQRGVLAWSRDGRVLAHAALAIGAVELYFIDTASGHLRAWSATIYAHSADVTAMAINGASLVSGSQEGALRVWDLLDTDSGSNWGIAASPRLSLTGHDTAITGISVSEQQGLVVSVSVGVCLLHSICTGKLLGLFSEAAEYGVSLARISDVSGKIVIYTNNGMLFLYKSSLVSEPLAKIETGEVVHDLVITKCDFGVGAKELVLCCGESGVVYCRAVSSQLEIVGKFRVWPAGYVSTLQVRGKMSEKNFPPLHSISVNESEEAVVVGAADGTLCLFPLPNFTKDGQIPLVGSMDVNAKLLSAKNAVLTKIDTTRVLATARGVASEAVGVASKLAKGFQSVFGGSN